MSRIGDDEFFLFGSQAAEVHHPRWFLAHLPEGSDIRFEVKNRGVLEREALKLAVQDARARADAMALGAGRTIDRVLRIEEQGVATPGQVPVRALAMREAAAATDTPVAAGQMEFRARVTVTATLK